MATSKRKREEDCGGWVSTPPVPSAGSSGNPILLDTPPKTASAKRARNKPTSDAPKPEKRAAIFKKKCPQNILDRVDRVMSQRFFMVDRRKEGGLFREEFSVLGSTGNVYTVIIDNKPSCNCPDAMKGNHCKHILFIFLKVLQVPQASGLWYQKALLTGELETIFAEAPLAPNAVANNQVREAYARATGQASTSKAPVGNEKKRRIPGPDDDCPICYDSMHGVAEKSLTFCEECGNALHMECFQQWQATAAKSRTSLTCVWCRAKWVVAGPAKIGGSSGAVRMAEGYINLSNVAGVSSVRDVSTYYHGPNGGSHYYHDYEDCEDYEDY